MKQESKLEQAAEQYAQPKIVSDDFIYPQSALTKIKKETFITAVKSEAAKEYWQSLTTPASNDPFIEKHLSIIKEKTIENLIHVHIEGMGELEKASVKYFLETGKVNGSFLQRLKDLILSTPKYITPKPTVEEGQTQELVGGMKGVYLTVAYFGKMTEEELVLSIMDIDPNKQVMVISPSPAPAPIKTEGEDEKIEVLKEIMSKFGEAHNLLAKTKLTTEEYQPISSLLANAKIELFNFYKEFKASAPPSPVGIESTGYTKYQILQAAKDGEVSMIDAEHIVSILEKESQSSTEEEIERVLNLAQCELRSMYRKVGIKDSNVLKDIDAVLEKVQSSLQLNK